MKKPDHKFNNDCFNMILLGYILLALFIFSLPSQFGIYFRHSFSRVHGVFIDYLATPIFFTDIVFIFLLLFYAKLIISKADYRVGAFFVLLGVIQIFLSEKPLIGLYTLIKYLQVVIVYALFSRIRIKKLNLFFLAMSVFQFALVFLQFVSKSSIQGIFYFFGERYMTLSSPGIAKTAINGIELLRPYGTFSHPNSLAGFFLLIHTYFLFSSKKQSVLIALLLLLSTLLIFLSFSKNAIFFYVIITFLHLIKKNITCFICAVSKIATAIALTVIVFSAKISPFSFAQRLSLFSDSLLIIKNHLLFGTGFGQYLYYQSLLPIKESFYFMQPVHNIFLLFIAQSGLIIGLFILIYLLNYFYKLRNNTVLIMCLFVIVSTGMFDHYWITLQQNLLVTGVILGISVNRYYS